MAHAILSSVQKGFPESLRVNVCNISPLKSMKMKQKAAYALDLTLFSFRFVETLRGDPFYEPIYLSTGL